MIFGGTCTYNVCEVVVGGGGGGGVSVCVCICACACVQACVSICACSPVPPSTTKVSNLSHRLCICTNIIGNLKYKCAIHFVQECWNLYTNKFAL